MAEKVIIKFSVKFQKELHEKIKSLKKHYGTQNNAELIKVLVNEKAQQLNPGSMEATTDATQ